MNNPTLDANIPVLTEIISRPTEESVLTSRTPAPLPTNTTPATQAEPMASSPPLKEPLPVEWDDAQWYRMEREIRERVLSQLLGRIDFVLEQRVRDSLADVLQTAVETLAGEIKNGLHQTIKDAVMRAVSQEITKLQSSKK